MGIVGVLAALLAGCADAGITGDDELQILAAATVADAGGAAEAFDKVTEISVQVRVGPDVVFDETLDFDPDGETQVRIGLPSSLAGAAIQLSVSLSAPDGVVFEGSASATLQDPGPTSIELTLTPVVAAVVFAVPPFTAIGETRRLAGAAVFATGDTVFGRTIAWRSLDPGILTVQTDGTAEARSEGQARIEASSSGVNTVGLALVVVEVVTVTVSPGEATISVGETLQFQITARDRNGNTLQRVPFWTSSATEVAEIDALGIATGVESGMTTIQASADGITGSAVLTVIDVPIAPAGLSGEIVSEATRAFTLSWQDRSSDETYFSIERSVEGGDWIEIGQAAENATTHRGTGVPGENSFRVLACNEQGCSNPSNEVSLTFLAGPPVVTTLTSPDVGVMRGSVQSGGAYTVAFQYGDTPNDFDSSPGYTQTPSQSASGDMEFSSALTDGTTGETVYYRIVATNEFGTAAGDVLSLDFPSVNTSASLSPTCEYYEPTITGRLRIDVPTDGSNPIDRVEFAFTGTDFYDEGVFAGPTLTDASASASLVGSFIRFEYSRDWDAPNIDLPWGALLVDFTVFFTSGAAASAGSEDASPTCPNSD